jgi:hypothetical protein
MLMENLQNEYQLTSDEQGLVKPLIENIEAMQRETQAILRAITRLRALEGNWNLVGDKLVRMQSPNGNG